MDELETNLREVIEMLLGDGEPVLESEFVGLQKIRVAWPDMGSIPALSSRQVAALLRRLGFQEAGRSA